MHVPGLKFLISKRLTMKSFKVTRVFADDLGESHFEELIYPLKDGRPIGFLSENIVNRSRRMILKSPKFHHFQARSGLKENYVICAATSVRQDLRGILMTSYSALPNACLFIYGSNLSQLLIYA
jgi:hypothetical protein